MYCKSGDQRLRNSQCDRKTRPKPKEPCIMKTCKRGKKFSWFTTNWSQCSVSCGSGTQFRENKCTYKTKNGRLHPAPTKKCRRSPFPTVPLEQSCTMVPCHSQLSNSRVPGAMAHRFNPHRGAAVHQPRRHDRFAITKSLGRMYARWMAGSWQKVS